MNSHVKYSVYLVAIGNELTSGKIVDTNTPYLAAELRKLGLEVTGAALVRDVHEEIVAALARAAAVADLVLTTGGLGPTSDDLTRQAVAAAAGVPLEEHAGALKKLEELFAARKRPMNPNNLRQVQFPAGARIVLNRTGTADAFVTPLPVPGAAKPVPVVSLPGIPRELEIIFAEELVPWLTKEFPAAEHVPAELILRGFGCSESYVGQQIEQCGLPPEIEVAYNPMFPEILLTFRHNGSEPRAARLAALAALEPRIRHALGREFVLGGREDSLPDLVAKLLVANGLTLAAAESCSGGMIADALVARPGASKFFSSSAVCYSNEAKSTYLGVRPALLSRYGAVSREIAIEMARGARHRTNADIAVSITGIAGPEGGTPEKPVGTFCIGLASADGEDAWQHFYPHERNMFRRYGAYLTLDLVRRKILGLPLTWERR